MVDMELRQHLVFEIDEDKRKPLSDQKIVKMLEKKGIVIAR